MRFGISTACYYPMETEEALKKVVETGVPCTEIFINTFSELEPDYVKELKGILLCGCTEVVSFHPFTSYLEPSFFFGDYDRRFRDGMEMYKRFFNVAAELGARYFVMHGAYIHHPLAIRDYIERYYKLHKLANSFGIKLAQENVGRCMSRDPKLFREMAKAIPDVNFVLDLKQIQRSDGTLEDFIDAMGNRIVHLHLSDSLVGMDCLPIGKGTFDFKGFFNTLVNLGYEGDAVLELYRSNYKDYNELVDSVKMLEHYK